MIYLYAAGIASLALTAAGLWMLRWSFEQVKRVEA